MSGSLIQDARASLRLLKASPGFSAAAVATLALGIGTSTALFSVIRGAILEPWPYDGADRIVTIRGTFPRLGAADRVTLSIPELAEVEARTDVFDAVIAGVSRNANLTERGTADRVRGAALTANVFPMLGVRPLLGRVFSSEEDRPGGPRVVVMGYGLWQRGFAGDRSVVGRPIRVSGETWTVLGVMPERFHWWDSDLYFPLALDRSATDRTARTLYVQGRVRAGLDLAGAESRLETLARRTERERFGAYPEYAGWRILLRPLVDDVLRDVRRALWVLLGAVVLLLALACTNVAGLLLARATDRRRELALRAALGASRGRIVRQILTESILLSLAAGGIGFAFARVAMDGILSLIPYGYIPAEALVRLDPSAAAFATAVSVVTGALFGLVPALGVTRGDITSVLREDGRGLTAGGRGQRRRELLVRVQIGIAVIMLSGAGLLIQSLTRLAAAPLGFDPSGVLTFRIALTAERYPTAARAAAFHEELLRRMVSMPGVESAASVSNPPLSGGTSTRFELEGRSAAEVGAVLDANEIVASDAYFETLRTPLLRGRGFTPRDDAGGPAVAVVNATMARRFWGTVNPVGLRLRKAVAGSPWLTVVGVAADVLSEPDGSPVRQTFFVPLAQASGPVRNVAVLLRSGLPAATLAAGARTRVTSLDREVPVFAIQTLDRIVEASRGGKRLAVLLMSGFAAAALVLATVGLSATVAFSVARRRREIGIRVALGAKPRDIRTMFIRDARAIFVPGAAVGILGGIALERVLRATLDWTTPANPLLFPVVVLLLASMMAAATLLPLRRAVLGDPADVLQE
ncbi:MAG: ABC transporter permease [Acidobacteriota bacterium]